MSSGQSSSVPGHSRQGLDRRAVALHARLRQLIQIELLGDNSDLIRKDKVIPMLESLDQWFSSYNGVPQEPAQNNTQLRQNLEPESQVEDPSPSGAQGVSTGSSDNVPTGPRQGVEIDHINDWPIEPSHQIIITNVDMRLLDIACEYSAEEVEAVLNTHLLQHEDPELRGKRVGGVTILQNHDIIMYAETVAEAKVLRSLCSKWMRVLGGRTRIRTFPVMVSGISLNDVGGTTDGEFFAQLVGYNPALLGDGKAQSAFYGRKPTRTTPLSVWARVTVEFYLPSQANLVIQRGLVWNDVQKECSSGELFPQCEHCWKLGHTKDRCTRPKVCNRCGESKHKFQCQRERRCVNCQGTHSANSRDCSHRRRVKREWRLGRHPTEWLVLDGPSKVMVPSTTAN